MSADISPTSADMVGIGIMGTVVGAALGALTTTLLANPAISLPTGTLFIAAVTGTGSILTGAIEVMDERTRAFRGIVPIICFIFSTLVLTPVMTLIGMPITVKNAILLSSSTLSIIGICGLTVVAIAEIIKKLVFQDQRAS